jgi:hypothetical protein
MLHVVMPFGCILLGCWVVLVRPRDGLAWVLLELLPLTSGMEHRSVQMVTLDQVR